MHLSGAALQRMQKREGREDVRVQALLERLVHVGDIGGRDLGDLVQVRYPPLDDFSDGDRLIDRTAHGLQNHLGEAFLLPIRGVDIAFSERSTRLDVRVHEP